MYDSHEKQARKKNVLAALTYPLQGLLQPAHTGALHFLTFQTLTLSLDSAQVQHRPFVFGSHKRKPTCKLRAALMFSWNPFLAPLMFHLSTLPLPLKPNWNPNPNCREELCSCTAFSFSPNKTLLGLKTFCGTLLPCTAPP